MIDDFRQPPTRKPARVDGLRRDFQTLPQPEQVVNPGDKPADDPLHYDEKQPEQPFQKPEEVASQQDNELLLQQASQALAHPALEALPEHATKDKKNRLKAILAWRPTKKQGIIIAVVAVLLVGGGVAAALTLTQKKPAPVTHKTVHKATPKPPAPKPILSPLTGLPVTAAQQARPVTAVMIENSLDARPQSGLDKAGVVFEAIAEGGITRFMALYQESNPGVLGPVRSSRPYYLDWLLPFQAGYAHVGGSPDALQRIKDLGVRDLDQFFNSSAYHRVSTRYAPHNMYTSMDALVGLETAKGWEHSSFTPFKHKAKEQPMATPAAKSISIGISGAYYNVHYDYDAPSNTYKRSEGGKPHIDNETKQQLSPKVVIALAIPYSHMADGYHSQYQTVGSGRMLLFQDGNVISGQWSKASPTDQFVFKDDAGAEMQLNPGQAWITVVDDIGAVTYQP